MLVRTVPFAPHRGTWAVAAALALLASGCIENLASEAELNNRLAAQQTQSDGLSDADSTDVDLDSTGSGTDQDGMPGLDVQPGEDSMPGQDSLPGDDGFPSDDSFPSEDGFPGTDGTPGPDQDDSTTQPGGDGIAPVDGVTCLTDADCNDLNACTDESCVSGACQFVPHTAGNPCPEGQSCQVGQCAATVAVCGDGVVGSGESCDDGNSSPGDGCGANCQVEGVVPAYMRFIPAATFVMGCAEGVDPGCASDEGPIHNVKLSAFFIDQSEVTAAAYQQCMIDGACSLPGTGDQATMGDSFKSQFPVNYVDHSQAAAFCKHVSKRLCTEAEWEFAGRGFSGHFYPWGNTLPSNLCLFANSQGCLGSPIGVGSYANGDSPFGVWDLAGNVAEWVADYYGAYKSGATVTNPTGPAGGAGFVVRGGHWDSPPAGLRTTARDNQGNSTQSSKIGFRCCMSF